MVRQRISGKMKSAALPEIAIHVSMTLMATITPALCRAARGLLGWNQEDLAKAANVALNTLRNFELGKSTPMANNLAAIQGALEAAGLQFIPGNGGGPGLRLKENPT